MLDTGKVFNRVLEVLPNTADSLKSLTNNAEFQEQVSRAGSIGSLISLGILLYDNIKDSLRTNEERAFGSVMKIAFDSAMEALPPSEKIKIKQITRQEELITELFSLFTEQRSKKWHFYLPSHPAIQRFRELVIDTLKNQDNRYDLANFFTNFNLIFEAKAREAVKNDANFAQFYEASKLKEYSIELMEYLEYVRSIKYEINPVDNKSFMEYYIKNNATKADIKTWNKSEDEINRNNA